jgi:hypothetical protein
MAYGDSATLLRMALNDPDFDADETLAAALVTPGQPGGPRPDDGGATKRYRALVSTLSFHVARNLQELHQWATSHSVVGKQGAANYGQCGALVQRATETQPNESSLGLTKWWLKGPRVLGNDAVPEGTAIAAGWDAGRYPNDGQHRVNNTAMIFLRPVLDGFEGFHQWKQRGGGDSGVVIDTRRRGDGAYAAENFYVILTLRRTRGIRGLSDMPDSSSHRGFGF